MSFFLEFRRGTDIFFLLLCDFATEQTNEQKNERTRQTLRFFLSHLFPLVTLEQSKSTPGDGGDTRETYLAKLSLSLSRPLLRPKQETALTLDDRFPAVVVRELLSGGEELMNELETAATKERHERSVLSFTLLNGVRLWDSSRFPRFGDGPTTLSVHYRYVAKHEHKSFGA